jgi:hypothetical protein
MDAPCPHQPTVQDCRDVPTGHSVSSPRQPRLMPKTAFVVSVWTTVAPRANASDAAVRGVQYSLEHPSLSYL